MSEIDWSRLKASEIKALAARNAIVIVPIGATEQHGPHLPSMVDWRCVHEVSHRAARIMEKTTPTVVAPTIPFGMSEHHMSLSGTITLDYATMYAVIRCVVTSAVRHGFKRIFVLNGHGGNTTALQNMIGELTVEYKGTSKNAPVNDGLAMDADVLWFRRGFVGAGSTFLAS